MQRFIHKYSFSVNNSFIKPHSAQLLKSSAEGVSIALFKISLGLVAHF